MLMRRLRRLSNDLSPEWRINEDWSYKTKRFLKTIKTQKGYEKVYLYKDNSVKHPTIHKLVASAFLPNPQNLPQVNHEECIIYG
jgi:hypothetical protein